MKQTLTIALAIFWVAVLMGRDARAQASDEKKEPPELEAVMKKVEADGEPDKISVGVGELLGLANKEPIPAKTLLRKPGRGASTFSYGGKVWVTFQATKNEAGEVVKIEEHQYFYIYLTQTDGVLRGAIVGHRGQGVRTIPLADAADAFAAEKSFWKKYVSTVSKP